MASPVQAAGGSAAESHSQGAGSGAAQPLALEELAAAEAEHCEAQAAGLLMQADGTLPALRQLGIAGLGGPTLLVSFLC